MIFNYTPGQMENILLLKDWPSQTFLYFLKAQKGSQKTLLVLFRKKNLEHSSKIEIDLSQSKQRQ